MIDRLPSVPGYVYELCRKLRARQTPAEEILWEVLRGRRFGGYKFRQQHPIGRYVADFCCTEARLVIEVDGPVHSRPDQADYDRIREGTIETLGLRVLRFSNRDVEDHLEMSIASIASELLPRDAGPG